MNASQLWATTFKSHLNCVACRSYVNKLDIYNQKREKIDTVNTPISELKNMIPYIDTWCENCTPRFGYRTSAQGRQERKLEAARVADLAKQPWYETSSQNFVIAQNFTVNKQKFYREAKNAPCSLCGSLFPYYVMAFHHILPKFKNLGEYVSGGMNIEAMIEEMEKCVLVCSNCDRELEYSDNLIPLPLWRYDYHKNRILNALLPKNQ